jgi:hypothetical protein
VLASWVLLVVEQSSRPAGPSGPRVGRRRKEVGRHFDSHIRRSLVMGHSRRSDARGHVQVGSEVLDPYAEVLPGKVVDAEDCLAQ